MNTKVITVLVFAVGQMPSYTGFLIRIGNVFFRING